MSGALRNLGKTRALLIPVWGLLALGAVMAPCLASWGHGRSAGLLYLLYSPVCHQEPARSFSAGGFSWAVCHRCSGIYIGILLASLVVSARLLRFSAGFRREWVLAAILLLTADAALPLAGFWTNTAATRFSTGLVFGVMLASLLLPGIAELFEGGAPGRHYRTCASELEGGS